MGFGLITAGLILLFNPVINVFDVIPDLIGFMLIVIGLTRMSYFYDRIEQSRKFFSYLALAELLKIFSILLIIDNVDNGSTKVLLTFVFSLGEAALFVPAVIWLFDGLSMISLKYKGAETVENKEGKKVKDVSTSARNYIIFFYILRSLATLLPELTELQMYDHVGSVSKYSRPLTEYKPTLYKLLALIVIVFGIFYIIKTVRFFSGLKKDRQLNDAFAEDFENARITRESFFLARRMKFSFNLFLVSVLCSATIIVDDINILVGAVSAAFLITAVLFMKKYSSGMTSVIILSVLRFGAAIASFVLQLRYFDNYSVEAVEWVEKAADSYYLMAAVTAAEHILAFASFTLFVLILIKDINEHLKICGVISETAQYSKKNRDKETMRSVRVLSAFAIITAFIGYISGAVFRFAVVEHEIYIVLNTVFELIFIVYGFYYVGKINNMIYDKEE